jgi:hypothetical protein
VVPPRSNRVSRAPPYSRTKELSYPYRAVTVSGAPFQTLPVRVPWPLAWSAFARRYLRSRSLGPKGQKIMLLSFPPATEMFQFAGFAACGYRFTTGYRQSGGLPHSEIRGSTVARTSPRLFAACHVLHRLSVPRHPPDALLVLRPRPAPSTRFARAKTARRTQKTAKDAACRLLIAAFRDRGAGIAPADARASAFAYPCPGPISSHRMMTGPASRSRLASRFQKAEDRCQMTDVRWRRRPSRASAPSDIPLRHRLFRMPFR